MDYEIQLKIRNAPLLNLMRDHGYKNAAELSRDMGIGRGGIDNLLSLKTPLYRGDDELSKTAKRLCEFFHVHPEELVPASHIHTPLKQNKFVAQVAEDQMRELSQSTRDPAKILEFFETESRDAFEDMLESVPFLNTREKHVLRCRLKDGLTLSETAKKTSGEFRYEISRERVRQIETKALKKIRLADKKKILELAGTHAESAGINMKNVESA